MDKERYVEHSLAWESLDGYSVTKGNYNLADIERKYIPIQTEIISDNKDKTIAELQQRIAELEAKLAEKEYSIGILNQHLTDKAIEIERLGEELEELKTENMNIFEYSQKIEQQLAEKEKEIDNRIQQLNEGKGYEN